MRYKLFKMKNNLECDILQFADDDNIILGQSSWNNTWAIKLVLHGFELALGL